MSSRPRTSLREVLEAIGRKALAQREGSVLQDLAGASDMPGIGGLSSDELTKAATGLLQVLATLTPPAGAAPSFARDMQSHHKAALALLDTPHTSTGIRGAASEVDVLRELRAAQDRARRATAVLRLRKAAEQTLAELDGEIAEPTRGTLIKRLETLHAELAGERDEQALANLAKTLDELQRLAADANSTARLAREAREARAKRRKDILVLLERRVEDAAESEHNALSLAAARVREALPESAGAAALHAAEQELEDFDALLNEIAAKVGQRRMRVARAGLALARLNSGGEAFQLHPAAPPAQAKSLQEDVTLLAKGGVKFGELAQAHLWDEPALSGFEQQVDALAKQVSELNETVCTALAKLAQAALAARQAVAAPKGLAFVARQQEAFEPRIKQAESAASTDVGQAEGAIKALDALGPQAAELSRALTLLSARIARADCTPTDALPSELLALATARDKAAQALAEVMPA